MDRWVEVRSLSVSGLSIRAMARKLRMSKKTIRKILRGEETPVKEIQRKDAYAHLVPHRAAIVAMLKARLIGTRIFHELRKLGYTGGKTVLYRYIAKLKSEEDLGQEKATVRFETAPGVQAQFDWSVYRVPLGGALTRLVVYDLVLSYSRRKFFWAALHESQEAVFEALERGFERFGGTVKQLLVDNARVFVKNPSPLYFEWNPRFLEFCKHFGIAPKACRVRRPQTKGKCERPFFTLEQHFIKGRSFLSFDDFCRELAAFNDELDNRDHYDLKVSPLLRFQQEEARALLELPSHPFLGSRVVFRKVSWDCLLSFEASKYSVPFLYAGKEVCCKVSQGRHLEIFSLGGERVAVHALAPKPGSVVLEKAHYEGLRPISPKTPACLRKTFLLTFPESRLFLEKLLAQQKWHPQRHLQGILELTSLYAKEDIQQALGMALACNTFSAAFIRGVLEKQSPLKAEPVSLRSLVPVPEVAMHQDLNDYERFLPKEGGSA